MSTRASHEAPLTTRNSMVTPTTACLPTWRAPIHTARTVACEPPLNDFCRSCRGQERHAETTLVALRQVTQLESKEARRNHLQTTMHQRRGHSEMPNNAVVGHQLIWPNASEKKANAATYAAWKSLRSKLCNPCTPPSRWAAADLISKRSSPSVSIFCRVSRDLAPISCMPCLMPCVR